jgi:outer membrane protein assembly factor BamB
LKTERKGRFLYLGIAFAGALLVLATVFVIVILPGLGGNTSKSSSASSTTSTLTVSTSSTAGTSTAGAPLAADWLTYHHDNQRTGVAQPPGPFSSPSLQWSRHVDGAVYAEPLIANGSAFVSTENDSVYSISVPTGTLRWRMNLGTPLPLSSLPCGDIDPVGITGTPVIDPSGSTLYVVSMLKNEGYRLFALASSTGQVRWDVPLNPTGFDYHVQQERGALALANGFVYIPFGGFTGDCGDYHGWVMGYPANGTGRLLSYQVPSTREAGIWSTGGVVVNAGGSLLVATGNSGSTTDFDFGESVIRLNPNLTVADYFAPSNWAALNSGDVDVGSISPLDLGNGLVFQAGKEGVGYLLSESHLGGVGGQLFSSHFCSSAFGAGALVGTAPIIPCTDGLHRLAVSTSGGSPSFAPSWSVTGFNSGPPIVAYGAVWAADIGNGTLFALDTATGHTLFHVDLGSFVHFTTPSAGENSVVVAATDKIYCFVV